MKAAILSLFISAMWASACRRLAAAADMPVKAPSAQAAPRAPVYDWSGSYIGANIGGAWSNSSADEQRQRRRGIPAALDSSAACRRATICRPGRFLYGIEGDFDWTTLTGTSGPISTPLGVLQATTNRNWITTVAARFGITSDRLLVYGKIGGGWAQGSTALNVVNGGTIFRLPHGWRRAGGRRHRIRLCVQLDRQARIRLSRAGQRDLVHAALRQCAPRSFRC